MIMYRQADGTYKEIGCIMTKDGNEINKIVDRYGNTFFSGGVRKTVSGYPCTLDKSNGKPVTSYKIYGNTVQNDTPTPENPVEVQSVGEPVTEGENSGKYEIPVVCRGKNLFDKSVDEWEIGVLGDDGINTGSVASHYTINFIRVISGAEYTWSGISRTTEMSVRVYFYDNNKKWIGRTPAYPSEAVISIMVPDNCTYIRLQAHSDIPIDYWQFELGAEATEYEPYYEPVRTSIFLDKPLETGEVLKFPENVFVRSDGTQETIILPGISTLAGTTIVEVHTEIQPSDMEITYKSRRKNNEH